MKWAIVAGLVVVVAAVGGIAVARGGGSQAGSCQAVDSGVLPEWARAGFSEKEPRIAHVIGRDDRLAAIFFGPLTAPPRKDEGNKILWVSREPQNAPSDLKLTATHLGSDETVRRTVPRGPGPSGIDMPKPGCWRVHAKWADQQDDLDLTYTAR
jgi:hypothetical protein